MIHFGKILLLLCFIYVANATKYHTYKGFNQNSTFPPEFLFGVGTSALQVEGGWNQGGRGWSLWDYHIFTDPEFIFDGTTHEVAADSYNQYKRDIGLLKELGVNVYRFSISWPRILPLGTPDYVNPEGIAYYNNLIDELLANGLTPMITIYHWDLPLRLAELGGWLNEDIANWLGDFARVVYQNFGDRVKTWLTINEPFVLCSLGYAYGIHPPRVITPGEGFYECGRNVLLAHARLYHIYHDEFKSQGGKVALIFSADMAYGVTDSHDDAEAVEDFLAFTLEQYAHPIFSPQGNYPQRLIDRVGNASSLQGYKQSRLRPFTPEQINYIRGTADFFALNSYSSYYVYRNDSVKELHAVPSFDDDMYVGYYTVPQETTGGSMWVYGYATGLYDLLIYLKKEYNDPVIYFTENGSSDELGFYDEEKVDYYRGYLNALLYAIDEGVDVRMYCAWSLMDTFEWNRGYLVRMGLYELDIDDPNRPVFPRKSALVYKEIIRSRKIDPDYNPEPNDL
ncbi:myrosinase 1-like isoform X1 [Leptidea sinapis]|uniref:myrosinase 1-like isoform X1 n=1 Tax=Leptidea sinapis TaxID=189913 RepID=UPI00212E884E|nr:myrosinase 1-like isoform X1 [Leptidea sinapis]